MENPSKIASKKIARCFAATNGESLFALVRKHKPMQNGMINPIPTILVAAATPTTKAIQMTFFGKGEWNQSMKERKNQTVNVAKILSAVK
mgnify:CR=1 FL=1